LFVQILCWSTFFERGGLVVVFVSGLNFENKIAMLQRIEGEDEGTWPPCV